ncbi:MAG: lipoyl(octanoyl) transferase LipB [Burkholderiales bacterium]|nr:lipoyl(octanoyl) transferase LipB [Burkholderiales bacterium]
MQQDASPVRHRGDPAGARIRLLALGRTAFGDTYQAMRRFTAGRTGETADELWLTEHPPVYTAGVAARSEHFPRSAATIPLLHADRGGQITYHGPGQAIAYAMLDLGRRGFGVRELVSRLEQGAIDLLATYNVQAGRRAGAPGVYVDGAKVAALGLRIRRGCSYHGIALNVDMDLSPFQAIDPCGFPGLRVTDCRSLGIAAGMEEIGARFAGILLAQLER